MSDLLNPLFLFPMLIILGEVIAAIWLSRRQTKWRLYWVIGTYLIFIAFAFALGFFARDEFGFSWIPLLIITEPWSLFLRGTHLNYAGFTQSFYGMTLGVFLNCAIFYLIDRLSYPKYSAQI